MRQTSLDALAEEFCDLSPSSTSFLQCELDLAGPGEHIQTPGQIEAMRRRVAELVPLVGERLRSPLEGEERSSAFTCSQRSTPTT